MDIAYRNTFSKLHVQLELFQTNVLIKKLAKVLLLENLKFSFFYDFMEFYGVCSE